MTAVYALYDDPDIVQRAVDGLRRAGLADDEIVVMSSEPFEEYEFSHRDKADWLYKVAGLGGLVGLGTGVWLTRMTQLAWPLKTSGMPIVTPWPNLIVTFELTMLGAILATVGTLLVSAKLPGRRSSLYDLEVTQGYILVGVAEPGQRAQAIAETLENAGPGRVKTVS